MSGLRELLEAWSWDLPRSDSRWCSVKCGHHDDHRASARVHIEEGCYACLACGLKAGSPEALVMTVQGVSYQQARQTLEGLGISTTVTETYSGKPWTKHSGKRFNQPWHRGRRHA